MMPQLRNPDVGLSPNPDVPDRTGLPRGIVPKFWCSRDSVVCALPGSINTNATYPQSLPNSHCSQSNHHQVNNNTMSSAHFEGAAMIGNPRPLDGKMMLLDASLYLGHQQTVLIALKYFNRDNVEFGNQGSFFIHTSVIGLLTDSTEVDNDEVLASIRDDGGYDLLGDADFILPAHTDRTEMRHPPYVEVCGIARNVSRSQFSFDVDADQYSSFLKTHSKKTGVFRLHAIVPDTGKFQKKRPLPQEKSFIFVSGFLSSISFTENDNKGTQFVIEVHHMVFGGRATASNSAAASSSSSSKKRRFNFDDDDESSAEPSSKRHHMEEVIEKPVQGEALVKQETLSTPATQPPTIRLPARSIPK